MELCGAVKYSRKYSVPIGSRRNADGIVFQSQGIIKAGAAGPMQVMWNIHNGLLRANGISERDQLLRISGTAAAA